jgi:hypothetical protein
MPARDTPARFHRFALAICLALAALWLPGCQRGAGPGQSTAPGVAVEQAALRPVDAVYLLRDRLLARDGAGFARLAVPPALHAELQTAWAQGRSRWPLDELPLDAHIPGMLATLQAPQADKALMATFRRQFANADRDIDQAIRTLMVFGGEYVQNDPEYDPDARDHVAQAIAALGGWALAAPLADPKRAQRFFATLSAAAVRSGIDGKAGNAAFAALGMTQSLNRLSPFLATLLAQLRQQYGLDIDATLRDMRVTLERQTGDEAMLRVQYVLAGQPVDARMPAVRIDGHWYLAGYVQRARQSLGPGPG